MDILSGPELQNVSSLYDFYETNQALIYSVLENQFDGCVYTDNKSIMQWAILRTPFLQHFIAGIPNNSCEEIIEDILFNIILKEQDEKEIVVFAISTQWHDILNRIFTKRKGVSDGRKIFAFNREKYNSIKRQSIPDNVVPVVELKKCMPYSLKDTWSAVLLADNKEVSSSKAIMVGKGMAEIEISTVEAFQGKGYATLTATLLIDKLLENNLTPTWSTWPFRLASQHIAQKLGFVAQPDAKAWIWMETM